MRSEFVLLASGLFITACGDNLHVTDDEASFGSEQEAVPVDDPSPRAIVAAFSFQSPSCEENRATGDAIVHYADDGSPVPNPSCRFTFDDGQVIDGCSLSTVFAEAGVHHAMLSVTDLDTGAHVDYESEFFVDFVIAANLDVSTFDRSISWNATVNVDADVRVFVQPEELVITDDPTYYLNRNFTVQVARDGVYTVVMLVEDERPTGPICTRRIEKQINAFCTGGEHTHPH